MLRAEQKLSWSVRLAHLAWATLALILWAHSPALASPADPYREEYLYDDLGRLKQKTNLNADVEQREIFTYDAAGNRILKAVAGTFFLLEGDTSFNADSLEQIKITRVGDIDTAQRIDVTLTDITAVAGVDYLYWSAANSSAVYTTDGVAITVDFAANETEKVIVLEGYPNLTPGDSVSVNLGNPQDFNGSTYVTATNTAVAIHQLIYIAGGIGASGPAQFVFGGNVTVAEGASATVTLKRKGDPTTAHTVVVKTLDGSALAGSDFTGIDTTVSFAANEIFKTVSIAVSTDAVSELNEVFSVVAASADNGALIGKPDAALVTIAGTSATASTVRLMDTAVYEGEATSITLVRDGDVSTAQYVDLRILKGTAGFEDFFSACGVSATDCYWQLVRFEVGQRLLYVSLPTRVDALTEGSEDFWVYAKRYDSSSPGFSDPVAKVTILNGSGPSTPSPITPSGAVSFAFDAPTVSVTEGNTATVTVTRTGATNSNHTVTIYRIEGTATSASANADYIPPPSSVSLYFGPDEMAKSFPIETLVDSLTETDENFMLFISGADNGAAIGSPQVTTVTISGTTPPSLLGSARLLDTAVYEGEPANITLVRDGDVSTAQYVELRILKGTAGFEDFLSACGVSATDCPLQILKFEVGQRLLYTTISTRTDALAEGSEDFWVYAKRYDSSSPGFSDPVAKVTILNGSGPSTPSPITPSGAVSFAFDAPTVSVTEGNTATVTVTRTGATNSNHTVTIYRIEGTATSASANADYIPPPSSVSLYFAPDEMAKSFPIETLVDSLSETDENFMLSIRAADNGAHIGSPDTATVKITGTASTPVSMISVGDATVTEGGSVAVQITRTGTITASETVEIHTVIGTAVTADFLQNCGFATVDCSYTTATFAANASTTTFTVNATNDSTVEGTEFLWVYARHYSSPSQGFTDHVAKVSIIDDDTATSVSIADLSVDEGATASLTVTRSGSGTATWQFVPFALSAGTASAGDDYTDSTGFAVFAPGATTATIQIPTTEDATAESSETFTVTLTAPDTYTTLSDGAATVTITDDD